MSDATTATPAVPPAIARDHPATAVEGAGHPQAHEGGGHSFEFLAVNASHNYPYPAIEWVHGHPALILNAAEYAKHNLANLTHDPRFESTVPDAGYLAWAKEAGDAEGAQGLAKAMTLARDESWLGAMPRGLSFFTHQTFWSTVALVLMALALLVFSRRKRDQHLPASRFQHVIEALVLFVRDEIVRPNIQQHGPDRWTPFFAPLFIALLTCNLFGLIPLFGTATGSIGVTAAWAGVTALLMLVLGMRENGVIGFWASIVPVHLEAKPGAIIGFTLMFPLELLSLVSRPVILAIRLFANMFAGHIVLLVFISLGFIVFASQPGNTGMSIGLGLFGWVMAVALYALELLVAVLQAYIFTLLSAVFIGMYMHPEH